jgi:TonB-linked SusC/RagA family outer membrane protein
MKKKLTEDISPERDIFRKIWMTMRLIVILIFVSLMQVSASVYSQKTRLNVKVENATLQQVFKALQEQSDFDFFYKNEQIPSDTRVTTDIKNESVEVILNQVLSGTGLSYHVIDKDIVISSNETVNKESTQQEQKVIKGKVYDQSGAGIPGVSIVVKGTTTGTTTDIDGIYSLILPANAKTLIFSFVGMKKQEIAIEGKTNINIILEEETIGLEEVVAIGYGTVRKSDVTGALASVSEKTIREKPVQNAVQAMQGKAAGVDIVSNVRPGEVASVSIRGSRSFSGTNSPLYVVDGIILMGSINDINPNDIASMEILKDASATAIYGSRGANGVVLITTKKGTKGSLTVNYDATMSFDNIHSLTNWASAGEALDRMRLTEINGGTYKSGSTISYPDPALDITKFGNGDYYTINAIRKGYDWIDPGTYSTVKTRATTPEEQAKGWPAQIPVYNPSNIPSTDWIGLLTRTAATQNHLLSLSAGNDKSKIYFSFGYLNNEGTQKNQGYNRYTIKINGDITPVKWMTTGVSINATMSKQKYGTINRSGSATGAQDAYGMALGQYRMAQPNDTTGTMILYPGNNKSSPVWNPFIDQLNSSDERRAVNIQANLYSEITITPWLKYRMNFGSGFRYQRNGTWQGSQSTLRRTANPQTANASYSTNDFFSYMIENLLYFNKSFGVHTFGATLMQSAQQNRTETSNMAASGITNDAPTWYDISANNSSTGPDSYGTSFVETSLTSYMGRINYTLLNKYIVTATGRYDGASVLAEGHKWEFFPSLAFAWKMQEESFLKPITWINELKIRGGYGVTGNSTVGAYSTMGPLSSYKYVFGTASAIGYLPYNMPNPSLGWEKTTQFNAGVDFGVLSNRISGSVELYLSNTSDNLMDRNIPSITGYPFITANIGKIRNKGIEIAISSVNIKTKDFRWTSDFNWTKNQEQIVELVNGKEDMLGNGWFIGQPLQVFRTYQTDGIWQNTPADLAEIVKWKANGYNFAPGQYKPVEQGTPNYKLEDNDKVIRGTIRPKWVAGLTNTFTYKNFELSAFIYARIGQSYYSSLQPGGTGGLTASPFTAVGYIRSMNPNNFWSPENPNARWSQPTSATAYNADVVRATYINDGSFVSVRNIALSYNIPSQLLDKYHVKKLQVYAQVLNPFLFGGEVVKAGINPDDATGWANYNSIADPTGGANNNTMTIKSWVLGIRLSF